MKNYAFSLQLAFAFLSCLAASAHDWHSPAEAASGHVASSESPPAYDASVTPPPVRKALATTNTMAGSLALQLLAATFTPFKPAVRYRWDATNFYVESEGIPSHPMLVGNRFWIGRFPLPQDYTGNNAWRIPILPIPAVAPRSAASGFYRGAIAMAANGVPIFNPLTTDGRDTYLDGELDQYGGHAGNGEDYHYHTPPLHLQPQIGIAMPLGYALDGYPLYGLLEPDGSTPVALDAFNGHTSAQGQYHYHSSRTYPYINGGFHGEVTEIGGQVDPQPHVDSPIPQPLGGARDAVFTVFTNTTPNNYSTTYVLNNQNYVVNWTLNRTNGTVRFESRQPNGSVTTNTYTNWKSAPTQAASTLRLTRTSPTQIRLLLGGQAGRGYELSSSTDLVQWTPRDYLLLDGVGATNVLWNFDTSRQFFRIR